VAKSSLGEDKGLKFAFNLKDYCINSSFSSVQGYSNFPLKVMTLLHKNLQKTALCLGLFFTSVTYLKALFLSKNTSVPRSKASFALAITSVPKIIGFAALLLLSACSENRYSENRWLMQAPCQVIVYAPLSIQSPDFNTIFSLAEQEARLLDYRLPEGPLAQLNLKGEGPVPPELFSTINEAVKIATLTEGAFDPTVLPLMELWDFEHGGYLPTNHEIAKILPKVNYQNIYLGDKSRVLLKNGARLDLGGIGQGVVVDYLAQLLVKQGFANFLINASGDILVSGLKPGNQPWRIRIRSPRKPGIDINSEDFSSAQLGYLGLIEIGKADTQFAIVTSGDYENRFVKNGVSYHHILDPHTGYPARGVASATVIAERCTIADALATAALVLGFDEGLQLLEALPFVEGLLVREIDGKLELAFTSGFPALIPDIE